MILSCPACQTRYLVPDTAIGPTGRQVRCASCRHSWFQEAATLDLAAAREEPVAVATRAAPPPPPPPPPEPAPPPVQPPVAPAADLVARYADEEPRRNPAKMWTLIAILFAVVTASGIGALYAFGPPDLAARLGLGPAGVPLTIEVTRKPERRPTLSGSELLAVTGRIVNPTDSVQTVPDIRAELRDGQGRAVYSWTITRPARTLPPGGSAAFDSAAVDVPRGSKALNLSFASAAE